MFEIKTAHDFFGKLKEDCQEFTKDTSSSRVALNCIMTGYHLHEWVWPDLLDGHPDRQRKVCDGNTFSDVDKYRKWLRDNVLAIRIARLLTNGTKHFGERRGEVRATTAKEEGGYFPAAYFPRNYFGRRYFGGPLHLVIELTDDSTMTAEELIGDLLAYWEKTFNELQ